MKRIFDIFASAVGLMFLSPVFLPVMLLVWIQDYKSPFYVAERVGKGGALFKMVKLRSMVVGADKTGVDSTSASDSRITPIGHFIRRTKLDELTQLWNVFRGDMSLVGPRPNVLRETRLYTEEEGRLLTVKPGITDFASIVFSDEGEILNGSSDPDIAYNQLIRPGKGLLGLFYIDNSGFLVDISLCFITVIGIFSRHRALAIIQSLLAKLGADEELIAVAGRKSPLLPSPPPGACNIVTSRDGSVD